MTIQRGHLLAAHMDGCMHGGALHGGHQLRSRQSRHDTRRLLHGLAVACGSVAAAWAWWLS